MKKLNLLFLIIISLLLCTGTSEVLAQDASEAVKHMDELSKTSGRVKSYTWQYVRSLAKGSEKRQTKSRGKLSQELAKTAQKIEAIEPFYGDSGMKDAMSAFINMYQTVINEDYAEIMDLQELIDDSYDAMEAYIRAQDIAGDKLDAASDDLDAAQAIFAARYNVQIADSDESELDKKIKRANEALGYYNEIYLLLYRCNLQEALLMDALERADVNSLQQNMNGQLSYAAEGLDSLSVMDGFKGDTKLKYAAKELLGYYQSESKVDLPKQLDFFLSKDKFERLDRMMSKKKKKDITKEDVDKYNKAVNDYNKSIGSYNSTNARMNTKRQKIFNAWEEASTAFFNKHVD